MNTINISKLNKADVLVALFNDSKQQGMGFLSPNGGDPLTKEDAEVLLTRSADFDYLRGRVMKVDLSGDSLDPRLYDRDNGEGAAEHAIRRITTP